MAIDAVPERAAQKSVASLVMVLALAATAALVLRGVFLGSYRVHGASMLPTLEPEDLVGGSRVAYGLRAGFALGTRAPSRGDVVVFHKPTEVDGPDLLVKRVIALPGDRISMNGPHPVINGWEVPACDAGPYLYPIPHGGIGGRLLVEFLDDQSYLTVFTPVTAPWLGTYEVKAGEVFVLGDNRNNSSDSRAWNGGKGNGLSTTAIEAKAKWWLLGSHRNQSADLGIFCGRSSASSGSNPWIRSRFATGCSDVCKIGRPRRTPRSLMRVDRKRASAAAFAIAVIAIGVLAFLWPSKKTLWPDQAAQRWFHFRDGRPIVLDEPQPIR